MVDYSTFPQWEQLLYKDRIRVNALKELERANEQLEKAGRVLPENKPINTGATFFYLLIAGGLCYMGYAAYQYFIKPELEKKKKQ